MAIRAPICDRGFVGRDRQRVVALIPFKDRRIHAISAFQPVIACTASEGIIPPFTTKAIIVTTSCDLVTKVATAHLLNTDECVCITECVLSRSSFQINDNTGLLGKVRSGTTVVYLVTAITTIKRIVTAASLKALISCCTCHYIIKHRAFDAFDIRESVCISAVVRDSAGAFISENGGNALFSRRVIIAS